MIAAEMKNAVSTVRVHDEFYVKEPQECMRQMNRIVAVSYQRRLSRQPVSIHCQPGMVDNRT